MKMLMLAMAALPACISSCNKGHDPVPQPDKSEVRYLCVGMETSARFGECPGCEKDAKRIHDLMSSRFGYSGDVLISDKARKSEVERLLKAGIESTGENGLFMFFYSGHGGQESLGGKEPDGSDSADEYLCLYDTYMLDDEIWNIVSRCKGRVLLYFDACHSATMYRSIKSDALVSSRGEKAEALAFDPKYLVRSRGFRFNSSKFMKARAMGVGMDKKEDTCPVGIL